MIPKEQQSAYQRWEMTSFGDERQDSQARRAATAPPPPAPEPVEIVPHINLPTAQELEAIREQARAEGYAEGLADAIGEGEVQAVDPELLAYALMGMNHFVSMRWILWDTDGELSPELLDDFARIIAGALRGATVPVES